MEKKNTKETSKNVASKASKELKDKNETKNEKSVAGSALVQTGSLQKKPTPKKK